MVRLTRAQTQERTRSGVLAAARAEFAAHGYRDARIDGIAERAGASRGAVYSNFPGKRALYLSVLAADAEAAEAGEPATAAAADVSSAREALAAIARVRLGTDLAAEVLDDDASREAYAQLLTLESLVLGLALERLGRPGRGVRAAATALTLLAGAHRLGATAPGFPDPFDVVAACELLADLPPDHGWPPPYLGHVSPAAVVDEPWPPGLPPAAGDGVVHVLGLHRLEAAEESVRTAPAGADVTIGIVTGDPDDLLPLARLVLARLRGTLARTVPAPARPPLRLLLGPTADELAAAAGLTVVDDDTEAAVRITGGRIVARASGRGAGHAAAAADVTPRVSDIGM
ncbi:TetR/AcrR family transcriptional regulator [Jiangella mangrovi]|uniref:AcrR family transcriptional regulator n=1 Tax=Jiangella mangrovi TaxID=1524084 RepID=A0A7W9GSW7_9ACTN|nr:TetR/AcrR family transcriptional regulator [Jiangella mangrovi]MBB5789337.1 AcrR family transcriptional regulator [Jiangella mangrovi]